MKSLLPVAPPSREPGAVRTMFDRVASRYDLANHVLSSGLDFWWRYRTTEIVAAWSPSRILDVATGSGDLALALTRRLPAAHVIGADFSEQMLAQARRKGLAHTVVADALELPFSDGVFDCTTVAFGLRNMSDWSAAVREIARVTAAGGHLMVLDFSLPRPPLRTVYRAYLHFVVPRVAGLITGEQGAYEYLGASIENFPMGADMVRLLNASGFENASATPLTGGIATVYTATKAASPT